MTKSDPALQVLLYQALAEPMGLLCQANPDLETARQRLYAARRAAADPDLDVLQFRASPFAEGNLVIVKETVEIKAHEHL